MKKRAILLSDKAMVLANMTWELSVKKGFRVRAIKQIEKLQEHPKEVDDAIRSSFGKDLHALLRFALELNSDDDALRLAFKAADLDESNVLHWTMLARCLADVVFKQHTRGPGKEWTPKRLLQLLDDVDSARKRNPRRGVATICKSLRKDRDYSQYAANTLRKRYVEAKSKYGSGKRLKYWGIDPSRLPKITVEGLFEGARISSKALSSAKMDWPIGKLGSSKRPIKLWVPRS